MFSNPKNFSIYVSLQKFLNFDIAILIKELKILIILYKFNFKYIFSNISRRNCRKHNKKYVKLALF